MHDRLYLVFLFDLFCKLYGFVMIGASAGAKRNTNKIRLQLT